jgi:HemY protein
MRNYLIFIVLLILAILIGIQLRLNPGYLIISAKHTTIEMHLWVAIVGLIILFLALHFLLKIIHYSGSIPNRVQSWSAHRRKNKALKATNHGLIELAEGNWSKAEKFLVKNVHDSSEPLLNYLALALAAQGQKAYERRAEYLHKAHDVAPNADMAIGITQARLQINHHQYEQALATLNHLHELNPKQQQVLRLLKYLYIKLQNWTLAEKLLPALKKYGGYPEEKYLEIAVLIYEHYFTQVKTVDDAQTLWHDLASNLQHIDRLKVAYAQCLIRVRSDQAAEKFVTKQLKKSWCTTLVALYADIQFDVKQQLFTAQKWLEVQQHDMNLFMTLGKLAMQNQIWGQAHDYLQAALAIQPTVPLYLLLGELAEKMGNQAESRNLYHQALMLAVTPRYSGML